MVPPKAAVKTPTRAAVSRGSAEGRAASRLAPMAAGGLRRPFPSSPTQLLSGLGFSVCGPLLWLPHTLAAGFPQSK